MKKTFFIMLCALLLCSGCARSQTLSLYILSRDNITDSMSDSEIAAAARQNGRVALTGDDFAGVMWEEQRFQVKAQAVPSVGTTTAESGGSALLKTDGEGGFVWMVNDRVVYVGGFVQGVGTAGSQRVPFIKDSGRTSFTIQTDDRYGEDIRFNKTLYRFFQNAGLLKSEISE